MDAVLLPWLEHPLAQALAAVRGHALLVHGPQGVGQFEFAQAMAAAWLCETPQASRRHGMACGECASCQLVRARTHPDLLVLLPEALQEALGFADGTESESADGKKAKPSREIKVDALRSAVAFAQQTSARGVAKVVVLHPAERMNAISANTLLKTLEEPPGAARFLLSCAAPEALLPTIRSRCQSTRLALPAPDEALAWLNAQKVTDAAVLLAAAGGQPLTVIERSATGVDATAWRRIPGEVASGLGATLAGWGLPLVIDTLQKLCHDTLVSSLGQSARFFPAESLQPLVGHADLGALTAWGKALRQAARTAEHPWNASLSVEALVLQAQSALRPNAKDATRGGTRVPAPRQASTTLRP